MTDADHTAQAQALTGGWIGRLPGDPEAGVSQEALDELDTLIAAALSEARLDERQRGDYWTGLAVDACKRWQDAETRLAALRGALEFVRSHIVTGALPKEQANREIKDVVEAALAAAPGTPAPHDCDAELRQGVLDWSTAAMGVQWTCSCGKRFVRIHDEAEGDAWWPAPGGEQGAPA